MRILILSASVGAGHMKAAEAVEAALRQRDPHTTVEHKDALAMMPGAFRRVYRDGYLDLVGRAPHVLGWLYARTDRPFHRDLVRLKVEQAGAQHLLDYVRAFRPDVVVCTHFLPTALLDRERRKGRFAGRIITVVTDFEVHGMWLAVPSDHYCVATEEARAHLEALGIAPRTISVTGIPTHPVFAETKAPGVMRKKHGLDAKLPVILLSAGGFGAGHASKLVEALAAAKLPAQIVAICGKSAALKASMEKLSAKQHGQPPHIRVMGFTTEMDEWMSAADLMLGKPGGLTTAESLVKGLAWIVVNPIPGQEERNAIFLLEHGAGIWCSNLHTLAHKVLLVLESPGRLAQMRAASSQLARPNAAAAIAVLCLSGTPQ